MLRMNNTICLAGQILTAIPFLQTAQKDGRCNANEGDKDSYAALAKFMKAYKLFYKSLEVGDIPYSDALKGEEGSSETQIRYTERGDAPSLGRFGRSVYFILIGQ